MVLGLHGRICSRVPELQAIVDKRFLTIKENTQERAKPHAASVYGQLRPGQSVSRQPILKKVSRHLHAANINAIFPKMSEYIQIIGSLNLQQNCSMLRPCVLEGGHVLYTSEVATKAAGMAILAHKKSSRSETWEVYVFEFALWRSLCSTHVLLVPHAEQPVEELQCGYDMLHVPCSG